MEDTDFSTVKTGAWASMKKYKAINFWRYLFYFFMISFNLALFSEYGINPFDFI